MGRVGGLTLAQVRARRFPSHPTPGPEWEGVTVTHREADGEKTDVLMCLLNSAGEYEWIKIGEST